MPNASIRLSESPAVLRSKFDRRALLPLPSDRLWKIEQGIVRAVLHTSGGEVLTLGLWGPGDVVGRPLWSGEFVQVECLTEVAAEALAAQEWPGLTEALIQHVQQTTTLIEILHCKQIELALLRLLTWLAQRFGQQQDQGWKIRLRLTHQDLADLVGSTRVTITRSLSSLEKQGLIQRQQRQITVRSGRFPFWHYEI